MKELDFSVEWSEEDQEYVGLCAQFPSLSWLDADEAKALEGIQIAVEEVLEDMERDDS